ncbi:MAG TPA: asparagine synthase (glutamine-hydrolyzing) [Terrimicrobiaceae bacterium]|nr:asparagine synthase (glutamine-hydrolyzing) [Terrimicrobiaceae bacterium]
MCGFAAIYYKQHGPGRQLRERLMHMGNLIAHRGPDDHGIWTDPREQVGFVHRRLSIIDLEAGHQPMCGGGLSVAYNGEIYNYLELRRQLEDHWTFKTHSDTEVILAAYSRWGEACVEHFRGMFAFALWDEAEKTLFCARDHFGIKPFYYAETSAGVAIGSEIKAVLGFLDRVEMDREALKDYLYFQLYLRGRTLFQGVHELPAAHWMKISPQGTEIRRYWEVFYHSDRDHSPAYFQERLEQLMRDSVDYHLRSDVPVGAYVSGGLDSSLIAILGARKTTGTFAGFHGKFSEGRAFDESSFAHAAARHGKIELHEQTITSRDFENSIRKVIWHLDHPIAGPGSFPQYCVSELAAKHRKVVLGGQGGDEVFGGYVRYLIAYFEQCIRGAIDGTLHDGNFIVTYESIIPNLKTLRGYEPMLKEFWREGLFESMDRRYFRLMNRSRDLSREVNWGELGDYNPFEPFSDLFNGHNVGHEAYFDKMTHFDFKTLLPALLHVEDRMSMAHGMESRVPFLDVPLVEFAATIPADVKFQHGRLKRLPLETFAHELPSEIVNREDKMGFPVPIHQWFQGELKGFVRDIFSTQKMRERGLFNTDEILSSIDNEPKFGRKIWGLLSLELWFQEFIDQPQKFTHQPNNIPS